MTPAGIARIVLFYLFAVFLVFYPLPAGPILVYLIIILSAMVFCLLAGVRLRPGNPLPGAAVGTVAITVVFVAALALGSVSITGTNLDLLDVLVPGILLQLFVACGEEMAFRGYLLGDLQKEAGLPAAIALSAAGFALLHLRSMIDTGISPASALIGLAAIAAAGVLLALLATRWGLLSAMGFHFCWNFLQYHVYGLGLEGDFPTVVRLAQAGGALMTGGSFGIEASLPGLCVVLLALGVVWYFYRRNVDHCPG